jgi:23S rRNA pseudouridine1911/1915/1917 synthase
LALATEEGDDDPGEDPGDGLELGTEAIDPTDRAALARAVAWYGGMPPWFDADGRLRVIERRIEVEDDYDGWRLDLYLRRRVPRLSRTRVQAIIGEGWLSAADGRRLKANSSVRGGEVLLMRRHARPEPPFPRTFGVLLDLPELMVVDKPANLPVHASARYYYGTLQRLMEERFPGGGLQIAHRLDRETSGCMVIARGGVNGAALKKSFAERKVHKLYLALVMGEPDWPGGEARCDLPLRLASREVSSLGVRMETAPGAADALPSETLFKVRQRGRGCALVECKPVTGRQHQLRAHLAALGYPIVGDKLYAHGDEAFRRYCHRAERMSDAEVAAEYGMARQALHAARVAFPHPVSGETLVVESPLPDDMADYLASHAAPHG